GQALDSVDELRSAVEERADTAGGGGDHWAALRTDLLDRRVAAFGAGQLDFGDAGETDAVDLRAGALEHRSLVIDVDPHPHELGAVGKQRNLGDLADRNAREADVR